MFAWSTEALVRSPHLDGATGRPLAVGIMLAALQTLPLAVRRRAPFIVLILVFGGAMAYGLELFTPSAVDLAELVAIYSVAAHRDRSSALAGFGVGLAFLVVLCIFRTRWLGPGEAVLVGCFFAVSLGAGMYQQRRQAGEAAQAADLERARTAQATAEERLAIARELHDAVGHAQTVVLFHAGVARMSFDSDPDRARRALSVVEERSRASLEEMQELVSSLRGTQSRQPLPTLADVDDLARATSEVGLEVSLTRDGAARQLPALVEVSAYRIVQEALTNVVRHAHARHADVVLAYGETRLDIEVRDDGAGPERPDISPPSFAGEGRATGGRGLVGMRERALCLHGKLDAGPQPGGGFAVKASLMLPKVGAELVAPEVAI